MRNHIAALIACLCVAAPATAQSTGDAAATEDQAWAVSCDAGRCNARLGLRDTRNGRLIATVVVALNKGEENGLLLVVVPLGISVQAGVKLVAGEEVKLLDIRTCLTDGCQAAGALEPAFLTAMEQAGALQVQFFPAEGDRPIGAALPTGKLADAVEQMRSSF